MSESEPIDILLTDIHKTINEYSHQFVERLGKELNVAYPPGIEPETRLRNAFSSINLNTDQKEALRFAIADLNAQVLFDLFSKIDGVTDPDCWPDNKIWSGMSLVEKNDSSDSEMLHDEFFSSYWNYDGSKT